MKNDFIELQFGRVEDIQREIIPVSSIHTVYVDCITKRKIVFKYSINEQLFEQTEYFGSETECAKRWITIERILGTFNQTTPGHGAPRPDDPYEEKL